MAPRRIAGSGLATAANSMAPSPCPVVPVLMLSHCASADAAQTHSRAADTARLPAPPWAGTWPLPFTVTAQRLIVVGEVAVLVVADDPQPVASARVESERRIESVRRSRVRICVSPGRCQRTAVVSRSLPYRRGRDESEQSRFRGFSRITPLRHTE